jgi:hypothetical protein
MSNTLEDSYIEAKAAAKLYAEAEVDLVKLKVAKRTTRFVGKVVASAITLLFGAVSLVILLSALGFALSDYFQNTSVGFLCSGLVGIVFTAIAAASMRKIVERPIIQRVLKELSDV